MPKRSFITGMLLLLLLTACLIWTGRGQQSLSEPHFNSAAFTPHTPLPGAGIFWETVSGHLVTPLY